MNDRRVSKLLKVDLIARNFGYVYLNNRLIHVGYDGIKVLQLLASIVAQRTSSNPYWLMRFRDKIRQVISIDRNEIGFQGTRKILIGIVRGTDCDHVRRLAIWLRGLCGGKYGTNTVANHRHHKNWRIRLTATKALKRLSAWHILRSIETLESNPRIRRVAKQKTPQPFAAKWAKSSLRKTTVRLHTARQDLFIDDSVVFKRVNFPKSIGVIRYYLKQIRNTVAGIVPK